MSKLEDLGDKLEARGIKVYNIPLEKITSCAIRINGQDAIVIDKSKLRNRTHEHTVLAHEFCHLETDALYRFNDSPIIKAKCEYRAQKKKVRMLVPAKELKDLLRRGYDKWEIAEFFEVDESVIDLAVDIYRATGEWESDGK